MQLVNRIADKLLDRLVTSGKASAACVNVEWKVCECRGHELWCHWCRYGSGCIVICNQWGVDGLCV